MGGGGGGVGIILFVLGPLIVPFRLTLIPVAAEEWKDQTEEGPWYVVFWFLNEKEFCSKTDVWTFAEVLPLNASGALYGGTALVRPPWK